MWGPAAASAGRFLSVAIVLAGLVAAVNALSTAQLAARHPVAGGAYTFGRREIHPMAGFLAGIGFVLGKTASIAAIALTVGWYAWPGNPALVATVAIVAAWLLNARGVTRTAAVATTIAIAVVLALGIFLAVGTGGVNNPSESTLTAAPEVGAWGIAGAAALIFFAFAGYARVATLGEEVREPSRTIPRAIIMALAGVIVVYAVVGTVLLGRLGPERLSHSERPLADVVAPHGGLTVAVVVVASTAAFGSLVALMAGVGRTTMAMAREGDLPRCLERQGVTGVPWLAEAVSGLVAIGLAWYGSLTVAIAASSCAVLVYYAVANAAAFRARRAGHTTRLEVPTWVSAAGFVLCLALAASLPWHVVVITASALAVAMVVRLWARRGQE